MIQPDIEDGAAEQQVDLPPPSSSSSGMRQIPASRQVSQHPMGMEDEDGPGPQDEVPPPPQDEVPPAAEGNDDDHGAPPTVGDLGQKSHTTADEERMSVDGLD